MPMQQGQPSHLLPRHSGAVCTGREDGVSLYRAWAEKVCSATKHCRRKTDATGNTQRQRRKPHVWRQRQNKRQPKDARSGDLTSRCFILAGEAGRLESRSILWGKKFVFLSPRLAKALANQLQAAGGVGYSPRLRFIAESSARTTNARPCGATSFAVS